MSHSHFDRESFYKLSDLQRSLLQVISIVYAPVAATPFASCLHRLGINDPKDNESFTLHSLRPFLVDLIHGDWLVGEQGKYHCPAGLRECSPVLTFHTRMVRSSPPETAVFHVNKHIII